MMISSMVTVAKKHKQPTVVVVIVAVTISAVAVLVRDANRVSGFSIADSILNLVRRSTVASTPP